VDSLDDSVLVDLIEYIQFRVNEKGFSILDDLSESERQGIVNAQNSIKVGKGIPHADIVAKYRKKYGIS
jgi:hypothetical protein